MDEDPILQAAIYSCPSPLSDIAPPRFALPPGACDTHAHVVSADIGRYPPIADRSYTPPPAPESDYLRMLDALGMTRGVLVQISTYGTDNRCMLETLARHPARLRGVAVIDASCPEPVLQDMHRAGVRGVRINTMLKGGVGYDQVEAIARKIAPLGWHMQFLMDIRDLPEHYALFAGLPVPGVIDHMGAIAVGDALDSVAVRCFLALIEHHGWWVKLSAAYRMGVPLDRLEESTPIVRLLLDTREDRMLWGSDWPHVNVTQMPDTGVLLNLLQAWVPDAGLRKQILVDNPQALYGFSALPAQA